jgi:hypothetical protein
VPLDYAAYEQGYKYCPTCDYEFPEPDPHGFAFRSAGGGSGNFSYGSAHEGGKMEAGFAIGMDKKETIYVSVCVAGKIISNYLLQISKS